MIKITEPNYRGAYKARTKKDNPSKTYRLREKVITAWPWYQQAYMSSLRGWVLKYWLLFNSKQIIPRDIDESQILSYADLWYIKKTNS